AAGQHAVPDVVAAGLAAGDDGDGVAVVQGREGVHVVAGDRAQLDGAGGRAVGLGAGLPGGRGRLSASGQEPKGQEGAAQRGMLPRGDLKEVDVHPRRLTDASGFSPDKLTKHNLFTTRHFFLDVYALAPGQSQKPHAHDDADKVYVVLDGTCRFSI